MAIEYSSDARVLLATSFPVFREIVLQYVQKTKSENEYLLKQEQIDEVYMDPHYQFLIKDVAEVGVELIALRKRAYDLTVQLELQKNIIFKAIEELQHKIADEQVDIKEGKASEKLLVQELDKTNDSLHTLNKIVDSEIKTLLEKFDTLMSQHNEEWRKHRGEMTEELIKILEEKKLLFEHEKQLILKQETVQELLEEFHRFPIPVKPEDIHKKSRYYFELEAALAVYASLTRAGVGDITLDKIKKEFEAE